MSPQILSKDSVAVHVDAVVYYRIFDPKMSVINIKDAPRATRLLAQTTLRNVLGAHTLSEMLSERDLISHQMQVCDVSSCCFGRSCMCVFVASFRHSY